MRLKGQDVFEVRPRRWLLHHFQVTIESPRGGSMRFRIAILIGVLLAFRAVTGAAEETPLLVHSPTVSKTQLVFVYGGYLWSVPRDGGVGRQLTTDGPAGLHVFSPDGTWVAVNGQNDA